MKRRWEQVLHLAETGIPLLKPSSGFSPPQRCISSTLYFSVGGRGCECKSEPLKEACVFYFTFSAKKKSELPLSGRLREPLPFDLKRTPAAALLSNEQVASDTVGEQQRRGRLEYFCCVYPLPRIQPPSSASHLTKNTSGKGRTL